MAWVGRERQNEDELNAGSFAIVQLYHKRDAGEPDDPNTYREFYEVGFVPDLYGAPELRRVDRGPIFSRWGEPRVRDWDSYVRTPMLIAQLDAYGVKHQDVFSGRFIHSVRFWLTSPYKRVVNSAKEKGRELTRKVKDIAGEASAELWRDAQRSDATSVTLAKKHASEDQGVKQFNRWKEKGGANFDDTFMPPPLPKGLA